MSLKKLGRYDLIRVLGKGAMGLVYEGRDPNLDRRVAIKTIKVEDLSQEAAAEYELRFRVEARSAARLQHPNIVSVYDSDRDLDVAYLVMEFIQGEDLKHHLDAGRLYTLDETLAIMADLLSALDYAHSQAIVHRDIKPANLLIEPGGRIKLTDFGVARIQDSGEATRTQGSMVGTLKYMAPEQVQGLPVDARADLFAAGIVLYQLLTGVRPFDGESDFSIIQQIVGHTPAAPTSFNPRLPPALDAVLARALMKSRDQRFATAQEFASALLAATSDASDRTVAPPDHGVRAGGSATWTATLRAGEALVGLNSGSGGASTVTQELELVYWKDIKDSSDVEDLQGFLARFPAGIYADLARRRLRKLVGEDTDRGERSAAGTLAMARGAGFEHTMLMAGQGATRTAAEASGTDRDQAVREALADGAASAQLPMPAITPTLPGGPAAAALSSSAETLPPGSVLSPQLRQALATAGAAPLPPDDAPPSGRRWQGALAAVALLALAGLAYAFWPAAQTPAVAVMPAASAPAALPTPAASAAVAVVPASSAPVAVGAPASASASVAAASKTAVAAAAAAAAKKITADKERPAKAPAAKTGPAVAGAAAGATNSAASGDHGKSVPSAESAKPAGDGAASGNPRAACENRMLLGFQICMSEQCAKPAFAQHPVCVERRAMEQRRLDAERNR